MIVVICSLQKNLAMKDLRNNQNRQNYLANAINRNLIVEKLKVVQQDAETKALRLEAELLSELISVIDKNDIETISRIYRRLRLNKFT